MSLTTQARKHYENRRMAAKWVLAVRHLRSRHLWICDEGTRAPNWRAA